MTVLKGTDQRVGIHDARILTDADIRILLFDVFPQAGKAVKTVYDDVLAAEIVQCQFFPG